MSSTLEIRTDDRLRLAGALLAAGEWPDQEQAVKAYKPHRVAEGARKYFAPHRQHPAVLGAASMVGRGEGVGQLYGQALNASWGGDLGAKVEDFKSAAQLDGFWSETHADWLEAENGARAVMARTDLGRFLDDLLGPQTRKLLLVPNLLFPGLQTVAASSAAEVVVWLPPPQAWGASPPWRYDERSDEVLAKAGETFVHALFEESLPGAYAALKPHAEAFALAAAVLFLGEAEGQAAGDQFMMMEKKTRGLKNLPALVGALESLLADRRAGKYNRLADYAPQLVGHLQA